jgi:hypothetical protein
MSVYSGLYGLLSAPYFLTVLCPDNSPTQRLHDVGPNKRLTVTRAGKSDRLPVCPPNTGLVSETSRGRARAESAYRHSRCYNIRRMVCSLGLLRFCSGALPGFPATPHRFWHTVAKHPTPNRGDPLAIQSKYESVSGKTIS